VSVIYSPQIVRRLGQRMWSPSFRSSEGGVSQFRCSPSWGHCPVLESRHMKSETRRLNKLTGASTNIAKRYKLTTAATEIIDEAGQIHGQKSRAVQITVEILWRTQRRLRPVLIRAARVRPSTPPLSHSMERQIFDGQFRGFLLVSGIHGCPHTSHTATRIVFQPMPRL
jgi:hypothetical protein